MWRVAPVAVTSGVTSANLRTFAPPSSAGRSLELIAEPEQRERARAGVRADHCAERDHELEIGVRPLLAHQSLKLGCAFRRCGVRDAEPVRRLVLRLGLERSRELGERLPLPAHSLDGLD